MASTDWTPITDGGPSGSSAIVDESGVGAPSTTALQILNELVYQNITGGALLDSQMVFWNRTVDGNSADVSLRAQDVLWDTGDKYSCRIQMAISFVNLFVRRWNAGVQTLLFNVSLPVGIFPVSPTSGTGWTKWRFKAITSAGNVLLRLEFWDGAAYIVVADITDAGASRILTAGRARFGHYNGQNSFWDDIQISSLA